MRYWSVMRILHNTLVTITWGKAIEGAAVWSDGGFVDSAKLYMRDILLSPHIAHHNSLLPQTQIAWRELYNKRLLGEVEQSHSKVAILKQFYIDSVVFIAVEGHCAHTERVLQDIVHLKVTEQAAGKVVQLCYIAADKHWRGEQRPERDVCILLIRG